MPTAPRARSRIFRKARPPIGSRPGTLAAPPGSPPPQIRVFACFDPERQRLRECIGPIRTLGPDYLAYALIDTLIDGYYPIAEGLTLELEDLEEDAVSASPGPEVLERIHQNRRRLVALRR